METKAVNYNKLSVQTLAFHKLTDAILLSFSFVKRGLSVMFEQVKVPDLWNSTAFYKISDSFLLAFEFCKDRGPSVIVWEMEMPLDFCKSRYITKKLVWNESYAAIWGKMWGRNLSSNIRF